MFDQIAFRGATRGLIKELSGFAKRFRLPQTESPAATAFLRRVGAELFEQRSQDLFRRLRRAFGYRRRDLAVSEEPGMVDLLTPDFSAHLHLDLDPNDLRRYALAIEVDQITRFRALYSDAFSRVFEDCFDRVVCLVNRPISIEGVIDRVEESPDRVSVDFPPDASRCVVSLTGMRAQLHFEPGMVTMMARPRPTIAELLEAAERLPGLLGLDPEAPLFESSLGS